MKIYDREKKKWVGVNEKHLSKKDPELCRGKKPHDYVLVLPLHVKFDPDIYKYDPMVYYNMMEEKRKYLEDFEARLVSLGLKDRSYWSGGEHKLYMCSVCKKQKHEWKSNK